MKIEVDLDFALPILVAILSVTLAISHQFLIPKSEIEEITNENLILFQEVSQANHEVNILTKELNSYHITQESLEDLGASPIDAKRAMMASEVYGIDPKWDGALITSECSWKEVTHDLPYVKGKCAINTKENRHVKYNVQSEFSNMLAGAQLFREYLDVYETYPKAIKRYKGWSPLGESQARHVMKIYHSMD